MSTHFLDFIKMKKNNTNFSINQINLNYEKPKQIIFLKYKM